MDPHAVTLAWGAARRKTRSTHWFKLILNHPISARVAVVSLSLRFNI
jgi:hypothetical protein